MVLNCLITITMIIRKDIMMTIITWMPKISEARSHLLVLGRVVSLETGARGPRKPMVNLSLIVE